MHDNSFAASVNRLRRAWVSGDRGQIDHAPLPCSTTTTRCAVLALAFCALQGAHVARSSADDRGAEAPKHYVIEMNCSPGDADAVGATLRTALALRGDESEVTVFIDRDAIPLAQRSTKAQPDNLRSETDRLFAKLSAAGVTVLVCPHCAAQQSLLNVKLREGLRFTNKEEWDAVRNRADQVFEYRPPDQAERDEQRVAEFAPVI